MIVSTWQTKQRRVDNVAVNDGTCTYFAKWVGNLDDPNLPYDEETGQFIFPISLADCDEIALDFAAGLNSYEYADSENRLEVRDLCANEYAEVLVVFDANGQFAIQEEGCLERHLRRSVNFIAFSRCEEGA